MYVGSLDSPEVSRVAAADAAALFVPPDRLLFPTGDALMSQRVNLASLEALGESVTVAPSVYIDSINGKAPCRLRESDRLRIGRALRSESLSG